MPTPLLFILAWLTIGAGVFLAFEAALDPRPRRRVALVLSRLPLIGASPWAAEAVVAALVLALGFVLMATGGLVLRSAIPW